MNAASTPYDLVRMVSEWLESALFPCVVSHRYAVPSQVRPVAYAGSGPSLMSGPARRLRQVPPVADMRSGPLFMSGPSVMSGRA